MKRTPTRILLICAAIGVALGLVGIGNSVAMVALSVAAPAFYPVLSGLYIVPGVVAASLLRRPGVGFLTQAIAGLVALPATSSLMAPGLAFLLFGAFLELPFLVTRYRIWKAWMFYIGATLVGAMGAFSAFALLDAGSLPVLVAILAPVLIILASLAWVAAGRGLAAALRKAGVAASLQPSVKQPAPEVASETPTA